MLKISKHHIAIQFGSRLTVQVVKLVPGFHFEANVFRVNRAVMRELQVWRLGFGLITS